MYTMQHHYVDRQPTVPATLFFTSLSYPIVRESYPIVRVCCSIVRVSYPIVRKSYHVFPFIS